MSQFDRALLNFYSNYGSISRRFWVIQCCKISWLWSPGQGSIKVIESGTIRQTGYDFLLVFYSTFVPKILDFKNSVTLKTELGSVKVIENVTIRKSAYDILIMFHNNHGPISCRFRDRRRFQSKIVKFSHPIVFCTPAEGAPLELGTSAGSRKQEWWGDRADKEVWWYLQPSG